MRRARMGVGTAARMLDRLTLILVKDNHKPSVMPRRREDILRQARERIAGIQASLKALDYLCSGTLLRRMMICGKPNCPCAKDPGARHGPYYQRGRMKGRKLVHRMVTAEQAVLLRLAIANYRQARKLMRAWERETERLIDAETAE